MVKGSAATIEADDDDDDDDDDDVTMLMMTTTMMMILTWIAFLLDSAWSQSTLRSAPMEGKTSSCETITRTARSTNTHVDIAPVRARAVVQQYTVPCHLQNQVLRPE